MYQGWLATILAVFSIPQRSLKGDAERRVPEAIDAGASSRAYCGSRQEAPRTDGGARCPVQILSPVKDATAQWSHEIGAPRTHPSSMPGVSSANLAHARAVVKKPVKGVPRSSGGSASVQNSSEHLPACAPMAKLRYKRKVPGPPSPDSRVSMEPPGEVSRKHTFAGANPPHPITPAPALPGPKTLAHGRFVGQAAGCGAKPSVHSST